MNTLMDSNRVLQFIIISINIVLGAVINIFTYDFLGIGILIFNMLMVVFLKIQHLRKRLFDMK